MLWHFSHQPEETGGFSLMSAISEYVKVLSDITGNLFRLLSQQVLLLWQEITSPAITVNIHSLNYNIWQLGYVIKTRDEKWRGGLKAETGLQTGGLLSTRLLFASRYHSFFPCWYVFFPEYRYIPVWIQVFVRTKRDVVLSTCVAILKNHSVVPGRSICGKCHVHQKLHAFSEGSVNPSLKLLLLSPICIGLADTTKTFRALLAKIEGKLRGNFHWD